MPDDDPLTPAVPSYPPIPMIQRGTQPSLPKPPPMIGSELAGGICCARGAAADPMPCPVHAPAAQESGMTEKRARKLASFLRETIPSCVAIATTMEIYLGREHLGDKRWIVVANGTVIRDPREFSPSSNGRVD